MAPTRKDGGLRYAQPTYKTAPTSTASGSAGDRDATSSAGGAAPIMATPTTMRPVTVLHGLGKILHRLLKVLVGRDRRRFGDVRKQRDARAGGNGDDSGASHDVPQEPASIHQIHVHLQNSAGSLPVEDNPAVGKAFRLSVVIVGLDPAIHENSPQTLIARFPSLTSFMDGRDKPGHDAAREASIVPPARRPQRKAHAPASRAEHAAPRAARSAPPPPSVTRRARRRRR